MNSIEPFTSLALLLAFLMPGIISQKIYSLFVTDPGRSQSAILLDALTYSCITFAITSPLAWLLLTSWRHLGFWLVAVALLIMLVVVPVFLPWAWLNIRNLPWIRGLGVKIIKRPWDYIFNRNATYWALITFRNGSRIAGFYGKHSFSAPDPQPEEIYFEQVWNIGPDGLLDGPVPDTGGLLVKGEEVLTIELFVYEEADLLPKGRSSLARSENHSVTPIPSAGEFQVHSTLGEQ